MNQPTPPTISDTAEPERTATRWEKVLDDIESQNAVQVRVDLIGIDPPVWRRVVVPRDWNLSQLHLVIQAAFGWTDSHLHEFHIGGLTYCVNNDMDVNFGPSTFDAAAVRLSDFENELELAFDYLDDFGDNWTHKVVFEQWLTLASTPTQATCVFGERAPPPEDVGGVSGYADFLTAIVDKQHPDHDQLTAWYGGPFDPGLFNCLETDRYVRNALNPGKRRRPHQPRRKSRTHSVEGAC